MSLLNLGGSVTPGEKSVYSFGLNGGATGSHIPKRNKKSMPLNSLVIWVVVKIMVPFWVLYIVRHLVIISVAQKGTLITTHMALRSLRLTLAHLSL